jgi:hypothetical protein
MINIIQQPSNTPTDDNIWWLIYDSDTNSITIGPLQCSGYTSSPITMVTADTLEELNSYITENNLVAPMGQEYVSSDLTV